MAYVLEDQFGFLLRLATQRYAGIFAALMPEELTPPQFAAMTVLYQNGPCSQNELGRRVAADGATIKGIVDRLVRRGLTQTAPDAQDGRMLAVSLTPAGAKIAATCIAAAQKISEATLAPLEAGERDLLMRVLAKLR